MVPWARILAAGVAIATVATLATVAAVVPAAATAKVNPPLPGVALAPIELSTEPTSIQPFSLQSYAPPRFFSINQVLAKRDRRRPGAGQRVASYAPAASATDAPAADMPAVKRGPEPFGLFAFQAPEGALWVKWRKLQRDMLDDDAALTVCHLDADACSAAELRFEKLVASARATKGTDRLMAVSKAVNALVQYTSDYAQFGKADVWSAPLATLKTQRGDCEDYAILKYSALRAAGVADSKLRLVLLHDSLSRQDHAILAAREGTQWYLLDNLGAGFFTDNQRPNYMPLYALNDKGVTLFAAPYAKQIHREVHKMPAVAEGEVGAGSSTPTTPYLL